METGTVLSFLLHGLKSKSFLPEGTAPLPFLFAFIAASSHSHVARSSHEFFRSAGAVFVLLRFAGGGAKPAAMDLRVPLLAAVLWTVSLAS